jgi:mannose-6-phosphate isomerase-like protein (cupin superfamily)
MTAGAVVRTADIQPLRLAGGASMTALLDTGAGGPGLVRRLIEVPPGAQFSGIAERAGAGELWFVIAGSARLEVDGQAGLALTPDRGLWLPPGSQYRVHADARAELRLDAVSLPATPAGQPADGASPLSCDLHECEVETTGDRKFRVLFGPGRGCAVATQFVGEIPPGRAPDHSHPYDEVVLILAGEGLAHINGADHELSAGTCLHLPPGFRHCLENTGAAMMRVLGVFHPADSPAAKLPGGG